MYDKVSTSLNFVEREKEILEFWRAHGIVEKTFTEREGAPVFTFFDGPPTANGRPHIGHVETRAIKDLIPRYKTMKGYQVFRKAGWDTHGLPVELEVEKALGINGKRQTEQYGIDPSIKKCKEAPLRHLRRQLHRVRLVVAEDHRGQGPALQGAQGRALLPALRHGAVLPRGRPGL